MLYKRIFLIILVRHVMTVNCSSNITEEAIVENFMVKPFLDDNNYIRLNLSWTRVIDKPHMISVRFKNNEDCNPINDVENYFITDNQYLIIPDMKMKYPADTLVHGCDYEIALENEELQEALQQIHYTVPECVGDRCACGDIRDSPYQLETITPVHKYYFLVTWKVLTTDNLTVHEVYYQRDIFDTKTFIPSKNIVYHKNGIQIPLPDLKSGVRYNLFVYFDDRYNECLYYSSIYLKVPDSRRTLFTVIIVIIVILGLIIVVYVGGKSSRKLRAKLNDSVTNLQKLILCYRPEDQQLSAPLSALNIRMENNILYTPLELDLAPHDTYEILATGVIIKEEIGEGAFGKVYRGGIYLQERSGEQIQVAIKMLRGVTALCMLLRRLAYPNRLRDISPMFNISPQSLSQIIRKTVDTIIENQVIKISNLNVLQWLNRDRLELYSQAVSRRGGAIQNCWGFIDGTVRQICRPSVEQEDYYSGHKRCHCVKYQSVIAPDGIIVSLKGAYMGKRHDAGIFRESQLYRELEQKTVFDDKLYVLYGDQAYGIRQLLLAPYAGQNILPHQEHFNATMRTLRVSVEWGFQKIISLFAFLDFKKNQKLLLQDVESLYKVGVILSNCHTCLYGSQTASYFNIEPPLLENYLAV